MAVCLRTGELTPSPNLPVGASKQVDKILTGHMAGGGTAKEVKVYSEITGCDWDIAENRRFFGKEGYRCGISVTSGVDCTIPGLALSLGILEIWNIANAQYHLCGPH